MPSPILGILAGMGPRSTAPFVDLVVTECQRQYGARDDIDFPRMMICSQPAPFRADRPVDHTALESAIRAGLQQLEQAGAAFVAIACNTAHIYYESLCRSVRIPVLHIAELAVATLPQTSRRIAVLAARATTESDIYQCRLRRHGVAVVEVEWQTAIDELLTAIRAGADPGEVTLRWRSLVDAARAAGADTILVACLDLSARLAHAPVDVTLVDAAQALACEAVRRWRGLAAADSTERVTPSAGVEQQCAAPDVHRGEFTISTDPARLDLAAVHAFLASSYWSTGIPATTLARAAAQSLSFGLFHREHQIGFARVVTDRATFAYLCDVYVLDHYRGRGLGTWLMQTVVAHPELQGLRRFVLVTRDAHALYTRFGFEPLARAEGFMEIHRPNVYAHATS
ncbi:MAG: GNAT family N-acetyltransferase [Planctomycetota bacterium]